MPSVAPTAPIILCLQLLNFEDAACWVMAQVHNDNFTNSHKHSMFVNIESVFNRSP